jgi:hypothetical protein
MIDYENVTMVVEITKRPTRMRREKKERRRKRRRSSIRRRDKKCPVSRATSLEGSQKPMHEVFLT